MTAYTSTIFALLAIVVLIAFGRVKDKNKASMLLMVINLLVAASIVSLVIYTHC